MGLWVVCRTAHFFRSQFITSLRNFLIQSIHLRSSKVNIFFPAPSSSETVPQNPVSRCFLPRNAQNKIPHNNPLFFFSKGRGRVFPHSCWVILFKASIEFIHLKLYTAKAEGRPVRRPFYERSAPDMMPTHSDATATAGTFLPFDSFLYSQARDAGRPFLQSPKRTKLP